jgi:hypothetical protein
MSEVQTQQSSTNTRLGATHFSSPDGWVRGTFTFVPPATCAYPDLYFHRKIIHVVSISLTLGSLL